MTSTHDYIEPQNTCFWTSFCLVFGSCATITTANLFVWTTKQQRSNSILAHGPLVSCHFGDFIKNASITCHAYCYGCDDANISVWPTVPATIPIWEALLVQLYWKSTNDINSTSRLISVFSIVTDYTTARYVILRSNTLQVYNLSICPNYSCHVGSAYLS